MDEFSKRGGASTRERKVRAMASKAFDLIRSKKLIETTSADFITVLEKGTVSTNIFLRKLHNLAFDLDWLPKCILSKKVRHCASAFLDEDSHQAKAFTSFGLTPQILV